MDDCDSTPNYSLEQVASMRAVRQPVWLHKWAGTVLHMRDTRRILVHPRFGVSVRKWRPAGLSWFLLLAIVLLGGCGAVGAVPARTSARTGPANPPSAAQPHVLTYVAIGASDAFGVGTSNPAADNWPTVLSHQLSDTLQASDTLHLINLGIPGELVGQALQNELPIALDAHPRLVTVWLSVNDFANGTSLATYQSQLTALLTSLRQNTSARVFIANLPDLSVLPALRRYDPVALRARIHQWNAAIAAIAAAQGAVLVDLSGYGNEIAQHPEYISSDGFHPSTIGARRLAEIFTQVILQSHIF